MKKDIYRLMNSVNIKDDESEVSDLSQEEKDMIFRMVTNQKGYKTMKRSAIIKSVAGVAALAACFALVFEISNNNKNTGDIKTADVVPADTTIEAATDAAPADNVTDAVQDENFQNTNSALNSFILKVDADSVDDFNDSNIAFKFEDYAVDNFLGMSFDICGENIDMVNASVSGGALCKVNKTTTKSPDLPSDMDQYIHVISQVTYDKNTFVNYEMTYAGNEITEKYDGNTKFGFCISGERYEEIVDSMGENLKGIHHTCIDEFNDEVLTVTVTYKDGTTETKNYNLNSGKIKVDVSEETIMNDNFEMKVLPEFVDSEDQPWIYGLLAVLDE